MVQTSNEYSYKKQLIKNDIVSVATELFKERGYTNTSVTAIAKEANIATGKIYLYFKSKDELFVKCVEAIIDSILEQVHNRLKNIPNPLEKIFSFYDTNIDLITQDPKIAKLLVIDIHQVQSMSFSKDEFLAYYKCIAYIKNLCENAIEKGFIRDVDVEALKNIISSCIDFIVRTWVFSDYTADVKSLKNKMLNILIYGIIRY